MFFSSIPQVHFKAVVSLQDCRIAAPIMKHEEVSELSIDRTGI